MQNLLNSMGFQVFFLPDKYKSEQKRQEKKNGYNPANEDINLRISVFDLF